MLLRKEIPTQVFSYEFCEKFQKNLICRTSANGYFLVSHYTVSPEVFYKNGALKTFYFEEHLRSTAFLISYQAEKIISSCGTTTTFIMFSSEEQAFLIKGLKNTYLFLPSLYRFPKDFLTL